MEKYQMRFSFRSKIYVRLYSLIIKSVKTWQGNAIEDQVISHTLPQHDFRKGFVPLIVKGKTFTLPLPCNWYNEFGGFLICTVIDM